ncbi:MAG: heavy metal translocating P-type ATPase [Gemmatimonadaceae bacterium]|nr:heavy metal translocating P-type ATPase [Gemmatimonadaceae bacterium]
MTDPVRLQRPSTPPGRGALVVPLRTLLIPLTTIAALLVGGALHLARPEPWDETLLFGALIVAGAPVVWRTVRGMLRGEFASDVVAMLAILTAVALREPIAGLVIVLMQSGGELLEHYAEGRASDAVRALEAEAPRIAHRLSAGARAVDIDVDAIVVGDRLLVRPGEMLPADAIVEEGRSHVDAARLTGEAIPVPAVPGIALRSGSVNLDGALTVRATAVAAASLYAQIVALVRTAQSEKAPIQRLADRYAVWFTPLTLVVCGIAWWISGDPQRVLAVLVVATPCPLILATPVAIIGGINRAARERIIVRTGGGLERLATVDTAVFDKTGTLTLGHPEVVEVVAVDGTTPDTVLALAAAVEGHSGHLLARSVVRAAEARALTVPDARGVVDTAGRGVRGEVEGVVIRVGASGFLTDELGPGSTALAPMPPAEGLVAWVARDRERIGWIRFADRIRDGVAPFLSRLRALGITRTLLLSGDAHANVAAVAAQVGITEARGDLLPPDKTGRVHSLMQEGRRVLMVGDGTNDAPALSAATVGIALAAHGGGISAEAADAVILVDDVTRVATAIAISRRTMRVARQSIGWGLGLSGAAMVVAALGWLPPIAGAVMQELIDVAVILNALRAGRDAT